MHVKRQSTSTRTHIQTAQTPLLGRHQVCTRTNPRNDMDTQTTTAIPMQTHTDNGTYTVVNAMPEIKVLASAVRRHFFSRLGGSQLGRDAAGACLKLLQVLLAVPLACLINGVSAERKTKRQRESARARETDREKFVSGAWGDRETQ